MENEKDPMLQAKLAEIQQRLKAPKNQRNNFGGYEYRSCEDILNAVKPLLMGAIVLLTDEVVEIGGRFYVKATATISEGDERISTNAMAREEETKKGMDAAQITGSASSYARKYALNGLFAIDDTKDADSTNTHGKEPKAAQPATVQPRHETPPTPQPQSGEQKPATQVPGMITEPQRRAIFAIKNALGMSDEELKYKFRIEHTAALTSKRASEIIEELKRIQEQK